jgi:lipopolysaccharide export system protein LptA
MKMRMKIYCFAFIALFCLLITAQIQVFAQSQKVNLQADKMVYDQKKGEISLSGSVRFEHGETSLTGDRAIFNTNAKTGNIRGNVKITQPGTTITADNMSVFYDKSRAELKGNVNLTTKRNPLTTGSGQSTQTRITSQAMVYNWAGRTAEASGTVTVMQGNRRANSDNAVYNGITEIITMTGNVKFEQGSNDWVTAQKVVIDMKNDTFSASGGVSGTFYVEMSEDQKTVQPSLGTEMIPDKLPSPDIEFKGQSVPE